LKSEEVCFEAHIACLLNEEQFVVVMYNFFRKP